MSLRAAKCPFSVNINSCISNRLISIRTFYLMEKKTNKFSRFFCRFVITEFVKTCDELVLEVLFVSFLFLHLQQNEFLFLDPIYSMHLEKKLIQCSRPQISEFHLFAITISLKMAFKSCHYNMIKKGNKINFHADQIFFPKL